MSTTSAPICFSLWRRCCGWLWKAAVAAIKAQGGTVGFMRMGLNMASGPTAIVGKRVVVVGGGNVAMDCTRTA